MSSIVIIPQIPSNGIIPTGQLQPKIVVVRQVLLGLEENKKKYIAKLTLVVSIVSNVDIHNDMKDLIQGMLYIFVLGGCFCFLFISLWFGRVMTWLQWYRMKGNGASLHPKRNMIFSYVGIFVVECAQAIFDSTFLSHLNGFISITQHPPPLMKSPPFLTERTPLHSYFPN